VAGELAEQLASPGLRLVVTYADSRIDDVDAFARELQSRVDAPVVGCTAGSVIGVADPDDVAVSTAVGFYGDWVRAGVGVATELAKSPIVRSRDAIRRAAAGLRLDAESLDPISHVAFTLADGTSGNEDGFCIGSAAAVPQIKVVGGLASIRRPNPRGARVFAFGEAFADAGVVVVLETTRRFEAFTSQHLVPTDVKAVVTAIRNRAITELDGRPAPQRLRELLEPLGIELHAPYPTTFTFARYVDGVPYVRVILGIDDDAIRLGTPVEPGHVMHVMRTGDLVGTTRADLAAVDKRLGGIETLLAWSCTARHREAEASGLVAELGATYGERPTCGFASFGEQTGMLLVTYTLAGLAFGAPRV
jgi:hypothetical protein